MKKSFPSLTCIKFSILLQWKYFTWATKRTFFTKPEWKKTSLITEVLLQQFLKLNQDILNKSQASMSSPLERAFPYCQILMTQAWFLRNKFSPKPGLTSKERNKLLGVSHSNFGAQNGIQVSPYLKRDGSRLNQITQNFLDKFFERKFKNE